MKIKTKLRALAIFPIIIAGAAILILFTLSSKIEAVNRKGESTLTISSMVSDLVIFGYEQGITGGERPLMQWAAQYKALREYLLKVRPSFDSPQEEELMKLIVQNHHDAGMLFSDLLDVRKRNRSRMAAGIYPDVTKNIINNIILHLQEIPVDAQKLHLMQQKRKIKLENGRNAAIGILILVIILLMPPLLLSLVTMITRPIERLKKGMEIVSSGNLGHRLNMDSRDEIGDLGRGFDAMTTTLQSITVSRDVLQTEIGERKRTEEALRKSEDAVRVRERMLNESQRVGQVGGWDWDAVGDVIWWSDEYYRIYGFEPGTPPPNYAEHLKAYTPESAVRLDAAVKRAMETGEPYELDLELANPTSGTRWIVARCEVKRDESGKICGLRGTAQNITDRKRVEEELRASEQRLSLHFLQTPLGVIEWNLRFEVTAWNPAAEAIFGYRRDEIMGAHASLIVPSAAKEHVDRIWGDLVGKKGGTRSTNENLTKDGRIIYCEWYNTPLVDNSGHVIGVASLVQDVSERKQAEDEIKRLAESLELRVMDRTAALRQKGDELRDSQTALMNIVEDLNEKTAELEDANEKLKDLDRLKSLFIASMSHELRTPLNSIIGFSSIMWNEWTGPLTDEQKENLAAILRAGKHLLALINDVIDVSKIEAGKLEPVPEDFDVYDVVQEAARTFAPDIDNKQLALNVLAPHRSICADRRRLLQCLLNLMSNAVKFTEAGAISVCAAQTADGRCIEFSVEDTGIGIGDEDMRKLFAPFVRIVSTQKAVVPGTGLGLYLTRKLVREVLKGDVAVKSSPGRGSTFTLTVPLAAEGGSDAQSARYRG